MSTEKVLKWEIHSGDMGWYIMCPKCEKKISIKDVRFADEAYLPRCPRCQALMSMDETDYDTIVSLGED